MSQGRPGSTGEIESLPAVVEGTGTLFIVLLAYAPKPFAALTPGELRAVAFLNSGRGRLAVLKYLAPVPEAAVFGSVLRNGREVRAWIRRRRISKDPEGRGRAHPPSRRAGKPVARGGAARGEDIGGDPAALLAALDVEAKEDDGDEEVL